LLTAFGLSPGGLRHSFKNTMGVTWISHKHNY